MTTKMGEKVQKTDVNKVAAVWDEFAKKYELDRRTSTPDAYLVDLEIKTLLKHIKNGGKLLDIGCANGYTSVSLARKRNIEAIGIDISSEMIKYANQLLKRDKEKLKGTAEFRVGNILDASFIKSLGWGNFDIALTKRVLINILTWDEQKDAITKIWRLLKPQGKYVMIEATVQGYEKMNRLRERFNLPKTLIRWHNNYLDEQKLIPFLKEKFDDIRVRDFSSTYYIGSRVIQPLVLKPFGKEPKYDAWINCFFSSLPSVGNYGIQKLIVCKKGK